MISVLSIDVGTSGVRAALFDELGNEVQGVRRRRNEAIADFTELDPDALVDEVIKSFDKLLTVTERAIDLISISAFWHSLVGIDSQGTPTTPLLTWADTSAAQFANELRSRFDEREIHARTGCRFHPSY